MTIMNRINIALAINEAYAMQAAVCITSIVENLTASIHIYMYILHIGDNSKIKRKLDYLLKKYKNISINYIDVDHILADRISFLKLSHERFSIETYFRFLLPELLPDVDKILYMDADTICLNDISILYDINIDNYYLGAVKDIYMIVWRRLDINIDKYISEVLNINDGYTYFQAGIILLNLRLMRQCDISNKCFSKLKEIGKPIVVDQDILNSVCKDSVLYIDNGWNYDINIENLKGNNFDHIKTYLSPEDYKNYISMKNNYKLIHFAGDAKPWKKIDTFLSKYFWKYAIRTPYFLNLLSVLFKSSLIRVKNKITK